MRRQKLIDLMINSGEYTNREYASQAIDRKLAECREEGMTPQEAWDATEEFMELTLEK